MMFSSKVISSIPANKVEDYLPKNIDHAALKSTSSALKMELSDIYKSSLIKPVLH